MSALACLRPLSLLFIAWAAFGAIGARACSDTAQDVFDVGNTATDSKCNYSTIQAAINAATCPAGTRIFITNELSYTSQHLSITNKNITLIGRAPGVHCAALTLACGAYPRPACPTTPLETIDGSHNNGASVITVRGTSDVTIQYLTITGGNDVIEGNDDEGGGIDYAAVGSLTINTSTIFDNTANNGGGIRIKGDGGRADLYINAHTFITNNTANDSGGGIRAEDNAYVHIDADPIWITQNKALSGSGGGIVAAGGAYLHIGSPGYLFSGVIYGNTAGQYGGGIALISGNGVPQADLFASDPARPVRIEQNRAYGAGGGVYLVPYEGFESGVDAALQLGGAQINDNIAPEGSGIYANTVGYHLGGDVYAYSGHCAAGVECNTVSNNLDLTVDASGHDVPTTRSAILIQSYGILRAQQLTMRGNHGAHAIRVADSLGQPLLLDTCLLAGNNTTDYLITTGSAAATITQCTLAYNSIGGPAVIRAETGFVMTNSIVAQGSLPTIAYTGTGNGETLDYILSLETATLGAGQHIINADPTFVDAGNGDFHLRANSLAIDKAPADAGNNHDLDQLPRDLDMSNVPNLDGPRDLGAYERQSPFDCGIGDTVFCNGFDGP